jgi:pimeloyl-ACP methyl ester carboxylesterase
MKDQRVKELLELAAAQAFQQAVAAQGNLYRLARRLGLVRLFGASLEGAPAMTAETRLEMALFASGQRGLDATSAEALERATDNGQLQAAPPLGDLPLIVQAAGVSMEQIPYWPEAQRRMAALSTNGRLIVVEGSGHVIHAEQPALVIDAVQQVIDQARGN